MGLELVCGALEISSDHIFIVSLSAYTSVFIRDKYCIDICIFKMKFILGNNDIVTFNLNLVFMLMKNILSRTSRGHFNKNAWKIGKN